MNFLKPGNVPLFSIVRYKRRDCHKLKKPEEKSSIILGKFKESKVFPKPGVSDKAVSLSFAIVETFNIKFIIFSPQYTSSGSDPS